MNRKNTTNNKILVSGFSLNIAAPVFIISIFKNKRACLFYFQYVFVIFAL